MKICYLSYEFPPGTPNGIGSYVYQSSLALARAGHEVTVIAGQEGTEPDEPLEGLRVVRLKWKPAGRFFLSRGATHRNLLHLARTCRRLHLEHPFDLIEGPDFRAEAYYLLKEPIDCPVVTKLHAPSYPLWELEARALKKPWLRRLLARWLVWSAREPLERLVITKATRLLAPSRAVALMAEQYAGVNFAEIDIVPNPFQPSAFEPSEAGQSTAETTVLYVGRLEVRKGVHLFARIIPEVLQIFPQARFLFLGRDFSFGQSPSMAAWLRDRLGNLAQSCDFPGEVPYSHVQDYMRRVAVCVFPSLWDNFPNVILEAMDAGACVVGSLRGGMAEMVEDGESGLLADPEAPETFAEKICLGLGDPALRRRLGRAARQRVYDLYRPEVILPGQIAAYQRAIETFRMQRTVR
jgi:glycosyltransferase involved in cell wall biosynthesis